jgi:2-desacetyl-2-hydroxyethyl bacteriochlorophyllide A dehydrogenase
MLKIVLARPGQFVAVEAADPRPAAGEALVRVHRIGVCGTDLHAFAGRQPFFEYPRILGHELGVEVIEVAPRMSAANGTDSTPANSDLKPGDHCAVEPYLRCGHCRACRLGRYNCCESLQCLGVHTDGGMREFFRVPVELLHKSDQLSLDQLALVETLGIGAHAVDRGGLQSGERALVVGAGPIGLAVVQFALLAGARVDVLEQNDARREFGEQFDVTTLAHPDGTRYDVVFDATGSAAAMAESLQHADHGGRLVFVGLVLGPVALDDPLFHRREVTLYASRNSCRDFPRIIRLMEEGRLDTQPWITHRLNLAQVPGEFAALCESPGLVKAMIEVGG